jgi:hypothetical protein
MQAAIGGRDRPTGNAADEGDIVKQRNVIGIP